VPGLSAEPNVDPDSTPRPTSRCGGMIDNWRWAGVPFYLRTGKHLSKRMTEIAIRFKPAPLAVRHHAGRGNPAQLAGHPHSAEGGHIAAIRYQAAWPCGQAATVRMDFCYADWFPKEPNVGYETLLHDVMVGDATLFNRADMVEAAWKVVQPVLDAWDSGKDGVDMYESGSAGPDDGRRNVAA
jgi:glucose-6-phosphate 1-dehydrogenase